MAQRRVTTIVQAGAPGGKSKALATPARIALTGPAAGDPRRIARAVSDLQAQVQTSTLATRSNPLSAPCIVRGLAVSSGATVTIKHTLGRNLTGWWIIRAHGAAPSFKELLPSDGGYPVGFNLSTALVVVAGSTGTFDFAIVGD